MQNLTEIANYAATIAWERFSKIYTLPVFMPPIEFNTRYTRTAGRCHLLEHKISISSKLYLKHMDYFHEVIIPHELAHTIAWALFQDNGHGKAWKSIMRAYGLPPERCHSLT